MTEFGNLQIALASGLVFIAVGISKFLKLDLEKDFFIASLRTTLQLIAVGFILGWILKSESLVVHLLAFLVMTLVAAQAVISRLKKKSWKIYFAALVSLVGGVWPLGLLSLAMFFPVDVFHQSTFFIPFTGVLLGNALSAISLSFVGLERVRAENIIEVETFKSLGANSWEACQRIYRDLLRSSLTPILNGMTVVGIVSLPGVMAGQLIGGVAPLTAARLQILVMFLVLLTALLGSLLALFLNHFFFMPGWLTLEEKMWNFPLERGEKLVLSGPSGAGKSRLLKSMTGLDKASIKEELQNRSAVKLVKRGKGEVYYVHQKAFFLTGTVEENLRWPYQFKKHLNTKYDRKLIESLLTKLGLSKEHLQKSAPHLSGGEAQLVHLIRCLQFQPEVLLLDEPSSSLDAQKMHLLETFLNDWVAEGSHKLVMITHNREQIERFSSRVLLLNDGNLSYE